MAGLLKMVIFHCHIFKNAGTTFDWSLRRNFGARFMQHLDRGKWKRGARYFSGLLDGNPGIQAISSHLIQLPLPRKEGMNIVPAFLVRHPIERAYSVYSFERHQAEHTAGSLQARQLAFDAYVAWRMQHSVAAAIRNFQTRCCYPGRLRASDCLSLAHLDAAQTTLRATPLSGVVDLYDESMVVFEEFLRSIHPGIDLSYRIQNRSGYSNSDGPDATDDVQARVEYVFSRVQEKTARRLAAENEHDLSLYRSTRKLLLARFHAIADCHARLAQFRARCAKLERV